MIRHFPAGGRRPAGFRLRGGVALLLVWSLAGQAALATSGREQTAFPLAAYSEQLNPLEKRLFAAAADGRLNESCLLDAALVASGVARADDLRRYEHRLAALVEELRDTGLVRGTPRQQAQAIFEFLHRRVLTGGYRLECTDLRQALDDGRFNCVSATVLFNCLAGHFGISAGGLELPGHAMSRLRLPEETIDVETTCPRWFHMLDDPAKQAQWAAGVQHRLAAKGRRQSREVTTVELTAMVYYNRGVDLLGEKSFAEAAAANAKALRLDPANATARGNLLATLNNWAVDLGTSRRYGEAADLLRRGLAIEPGYETFSVNYVHVCRQWIEHLAAAGRFDEALAVLARAAAQRPDCRYFQQIRDELRRRAGARDEG